MGTVVSGARWFAPRTMAEVDDFTGAINAAIGVEERFVTGAEIRLATGVGIGEIPIAVADIEPGEIGLRGIGGGEICFGKIGMILRRLRGRQVGAKLGTGLRGGAIGDDDGDDFSFG